MPRARKNPVSGIRKSIEEKIRTEGNLDLLLNTISSAASGDYDGVPAPLDEWEYKRRLSELANRLFRSRYLVKEDLKELRKRG